MEDSGNPTCPRCKKRPRHRTSSRLATYCKECQATYVRERSGYVPAERTCASCGHTYRGNGRAKAQLCLACRATNCITCGAEKKPGEQQHSECTKCRVPGGPCLECGVQPRAGTKRTCWRCYYKKNPQRDSKFGLAPGQYSQMLEAQHGLCAICLNPEKQINKETGEPLALSVDHDRSCCPGNRSCGKCLRGLTCRNCNVMLGMAQDDSVILRAAADYLELHFTLKEEHAPARGDAA